MAVDVRCLVSAGKTDDPAAHLRPSQMQVHGLAGALPAAGRQHRRFAAVQRAQPRQQLLRQVAEPPLLGLRGDLCPVQGIGAKQLKLPCLDPPGGGVHHAAVLKFIKAVAHGRQHQAGLPGMAIHLKFHFPLHIAAVLFKILGLHGRSPFSYSGCVAGGQANRFCSRLYS